MKQSTWDGGEYMLKVKNVSKQYRGEDKLLFDAVSDVSLSMEDHCIYALVGESGCGKSTLSRLILGLESPSSGQILLDGKPISRKGKRNRKETAKAIQLVLQDGKSALDPHFTVYQAIAEPIRNLLDLSKDKEQARVYELLDRMGLPKETANKKTGELSGGQQKRVGIARALAVSRAISSFDESIRIHQRFGCHSAQKYFGIAKKSSGGRTMLLSFHYP